jgi:hypothetical protein
MALEYRSAPTFSPDGKYRAQIKELDFGPMDTLHTKVEVRSRWHLFPETVFTSHGVPQEIETKWPSASELVIRYASGYPSDRGDAVLCQSQFKALRIACEPVAGYTIHPDSTASRGQQLRAAIDQRYRGVSDAHAITGDGVQITDIVLKYIPVGTPFRDAEAILMAAGFIVSRHAPKQNPPSPRDVATIFNYGAWSNCRVGVKVELYPRGPSDHSTVGNIAAWITGTCP